MTRHRRPPPPDRLSPWIPAIAGVTGLLFVGSVVAIAHPPRPAVDMTAARGGAEEPTTVTVATEPVAVSSIATGSPVPSPRPGTTSVHVPTATVRSRAAATPAITTTAQTATAPTVTTTAEATTATETTATTTETTEPTLLPTDVLPTALPVETTSEETLP